MMAQACPPSLDSMEKATEPEFHRALLSPLWKAPQVLFPWVPSPGYCKIFGCKIFGQCSKILPALVSLLSWIPFACHWPHIFSGLLSPWPALCDQKLAGWESRQIVSDFG